MRGVALLIGVLVSGCPGAGGGTQAGTGTAGTTTSSGTTGTATATEGTATGSPGAEGGEMSALLEAHNGFRARHCAPPLAWSPELARSAQAWADDLVSQGCKFGHSGGSHGENLAAGTDGAFGPSDVAAMWYGEVDAYDFASGGFSSDTGHFTQLVWVGTQQVGCGASVCNGMRIWVCQYDPPGNYEGEYRRNVLPSSCARGR